ncbi:hypothetical protein GN244_ATG02543 [Phytophthora infestans]|uniref:Uncharacterized protein n=1 Tax=Phytophthora infestans TaxID=4787 RepID=A0A833TBT7_PHYIN|nr:hypothetical protein GN244_ATG02543 [Phytophthora infestans]KAF4149967.1 hypothetical protein GN958_ATG00906 [Phytophthora infestans]
MDPDVESDTESLTEMLAVRLSQGRPLSRSFPIARIGDFQTLQSHLSFFCHSRADVRVASTADVPVVPSASTYQYDSGPSSGCTNDRVVTGDVGSPRLRGGADCNHGAYSYDAADTFVSSSQLAIPPAVAAPLTGGSISTRDTECTASESI